jgi:SAM-dependent methyltransferase
MDAEQLEFPDAAFDRVFCAFGVMFFPDLARALEEFRRVLKVGGRVGISTWRVSQTADLGAVLEELGLRPGQPPGWITEPADLARPLVEAGFRDVQVLVDTHAFSYADLDGYWANARSTGMRAAVEALDEAQREKVRAQLAERLQPYQHPDGIRIEATALLAVATR